MAAPTYWADKLVNKIISTRSNRREFLKATTVAGLSVSALGAIGALSGYAGVQPTQDKNTELQQEIYILMWKRKDLSSSERVERLSEILDKAKDPAITQAAAEGLMLFADDRVFKKLTKIFEKFPDNAPLHHYVFPLMTIHFILNPQARRHIDAFFFKNKMFEDNGDVIQLEKKDKLEVREKWNGVFYWGNFSFRSLRKRLRNARLKDNHGNELIQEHDIDRLIKAIFPPFNAFARYPDNAALTRDFMIRRFGSIVDYTKTLKPDEFTKKTPEQAKADQEAFGKPKKKIPDWKKQLFDESLPIDDRILALLNWDEVENLPQEPANFDLLTKMLDNEPPEMKRAVVAIFGSSWEPSFPIALQDTAGGIPS